jgi:hypothetical protein
MKYNNVYIIFFALIITFYPMLTIAASDAKLTLIVIDEDAQLIDDAQVEMCFFGGCRGNDIYRERTGSDGVFSKASSSSDGRVGGTVKKDGYYESSFHYAFSPFRKKFGRWQPWDKQITVVLRPIVNPVPMYVRDRWISIPVHNMEVGYDLIKSDWVAPFGQGMAVDLIVKSNINISEKESDSTLTITFSSKHDGIQNIKSSRGIFDSGSRFKLPRLAPETGYLPKYVVRRYSGPKWGVISRDDSNNFIFRVRSVVDKEGKVVNALYGKIRGDFGFAPLEGVAGDFQMHYYLNPDGTRNLEYDPKRNLFHKLSLMEGPQLP